jgi:integrase
VAVNHHLIPGLGKHKLAKLRPEHLERLYLNIMKTPRRTAAPVGRQRPTRCIALSGRH